MDHHSPKVNKSEHEEIQVLVHGNHKDIQVVGKRLEEAIKGIESMRSKGSRNNPFVMELVKMLVDQRMVHPTMEPVDATISKEQERGYRSSQV